MTAVYTQKSYYPDNGSGVLLSGVAHNLTGHWSGNITNNRYEVYPPGSYQIGDYWYKVSGMVDGGYWALNSYSYWYQQTFSCCCGGCVEANNEGYINTNVPARNANPGNCSSLQPNGYTQQGTSCYSYYWYVNLDTCYFNVFACCSLTCQYTNTYYIAYYDIWVPSWRTDYNIYKYQYGNWDLVGTTSINTGSDPVFFS